MWLEDYLSKWNKMLFMVCHSQDFLNNVCTHIVHLDQHHRRLVYYRGNYDSFVDTRNDAMTEQLKRCVRIFPRISLRISLAGTRPSRRTSRT